MKIQKMHINPLNGFTLVELLVAIAVVGVIAAAAGPSMSSLIRNNALGSSTNKFLSAINYARSEAITRNAPITLCRRSNTDICTTTGDWENGWIIFADANLNGVIDTGEDPIRYFDELNTGQTLIDDISSSANRVNFFTYLADGRILSGDPNSNFPATGTVSMYLCAKGANPSGDTDKSRTLTFNVIGRATASQGAASCP